MGKWLPSRKISLLIVVAILIVGYFFISKNEKNTNESKNEVLSISNILIKNISEKDTDGDGLKDWEEELWGTDINNKDTDGDGTNDNEETLQGRDPLVAGPDDYIGNGYIKKQKNINETDLTETDIVARELISGYMELKKSGKLNSRTEKELINSIVEKKYSNITNSKKYASKDLLIINKNDKATLQKYWDNLVILMEVGYSSENDLIIVKNALEKNDEKEIIKLEENSVLYKNTQTKLSKIEVPSDLVNIHLNIINLLGNISANTEKMSLILEDPIIGLINIKEYNNNEYLLMEEFSKLGEYLTSKKVVIQ